MTDTQTLVEATMKKLRNIPGATQQFYKQSKKTPQIVHAWKTGRSKPKPEDLLIFIKVATSVIKEKGSEFKEISEKNDKATAELLGLINA